MTGDQAGELNEIDPLPIATGNPLVDPVTEIRCRASAWWISIAVPSGAQLT